MRLTSRAALAGAVTLSAAIMATAAACTGDDPNLGTTDPASDAATPDSGGGNPPVDAGGGTDAGLVCPIDSADCDGDPKNGCETNVKTSPAHCGVCGHACGGTATCTGGTCDVEKLRDGLDHPFALELAGPRLVWYEGDGSYIQGCRANDCATSTLRLAEVGESSTNASLQTNVDLSPRQIAAGASDFYFHQCPSGSSFDCTVAKCALTGCKLLGSTNLTPSSGERRALILIGLGVPATAVFVHHPLDGLRRTEIADGGVTYGSYGIGDYFGGMYADKDRFLWLDDNTSMANPTGGVYVCPIGGCTGAPKMLLGPPVKLLAYGGGRAVTSTGGTGASAGSVTACDVNGCDLAGDVLATNQAYVRDIVADDKDVYWVTAGNANVKAATTSVGTVMRCALPKCAGGPVKVADAQTNPVSVRLDATHVYWMTFGTAGSTNGAIFRRRR